MEPDSPVFVDANVFLRFLVADDERMFQQCRQLFERVRSDDLAVWTSHLVMAEVVWTLSSFYKEPRESIAAMLRGLLNLRSLHIERREMLQSVVDVYAMQNVSFNDAYHSVEIARRGRSVVCTYDRGFDRLGVTRIEPAALLP